MAYKSPILLKIKDVKTAQNDIFPCKCLFPLQLNSIAGFLLSVVSDDSNYQIII